MTRPVDQIPKREPQPSMAFPDGMSGAERLKRLVAVEGNLREQHFLALQATEEVRQHVPAEYHSWAYDLRRGRMFPLGGFMRFIDLLSRGRLSRVKARDLALRLLELARQYVDLILSTPDVEAVEVKQEKPRVWPKPRATQPLYIVKPERGPGEGTSGRASA